MSIAQRGNPVLGIRFLSLMALTSICFLMTGCSKPPMELLNASYDPTRELWGDLNAAFIPVYEKQTGEKLTIKQSHAGSGPQARAILDGLQADVATLSLWSDTNALHKKGNLIKEDWIDQLPNRSLPYTSTVLFVVRKGNPKKVYDWADLAKPDIQIITPNPKTSGNGKLSFLAAWGSVILTGGSEAKAKEFITTFQFLTPVHAVRPQRSPRSKSETCI
jgi:sulfate/thiosulfate-binding protein